MVHRYTYVPTLERNVIKYFRTSLYDIPLKCCLQGEHILKNNTHNPKTQSR